MKKAKPTAQKPQRVAQAAAVRQVGRKNAVAKSRGLAQQSSAVAVQKARRTALAKARGKPQTQAATPQRKQPATIRVMRQAPGSAGKARVKPVIASPQPRQGFKITVVNEYVFARLRSCLMRCCM